MPNRINEKDYTAPAPRDPAQVRLEAIQEATRAATATVNNALKNAGMLTPAQQAVESARESGKFQAPAEKPLTPQEKAAQQTAAAQAAAIKPVLTDAEKAAGYTIQWVRTGVAGAGEWRKIKPFSAGTTKVALNASGATTDGANPPVGTPPAFVYNKTTGKWEQPPKPLTPGSWVWDNLKGWVNTTINPGATGNTTEGGPTLARDTFKNTLALFFGAQEMSQAWVDVLYKSVANFYNTGSTIDEALNLSLQDIRNNPTMKPFTDRFRGVYALQDRLAKGEAIVVPTIAEYFKSEAAMGDVLRGVGLGELATQDFLGDVLGRGKSVLEVTNLIQNTFKAIDEAPTALKADLQTYFPGVDRTSLAKALLTGKEGWAELDRKVRGISVLSAAKTQGVDINLASATDIADLGYDYTGALSGFQQVKALERGKTLAEFSGTKFGQEQAVGAVFQKNAQALADIEKLTATEIGRFSGSAGRLASRSRSQGLF